MREKVYARHRGLLSHALKLDYPIWYLLICPATVTHNAMDPPSPTSSLASESDIEMLSLDEINGSPKHYEPRESAQSLPDDIDSDDDEGGERALLGENTQTRWKEKHLSKFLVVWNQTSGIVVEVCVSSFRSSVPTRAPEL